MMAYKVVTVAARRSGVLAASSPYSLIYTKHEIVTARPDTLGIFCFTSINQARRFADMVRGMGFYEVIKVLGIGFPSYPTAIPNTVDTHGLNYYYRTLLAETVPPLLQSPPPKTVCFPSVLVLE